MDKSTTERRILLHSMCMILAGLIWGLAIPQTPFPRIALSAHIQYEVNGLLFIVLALVLIGAKPTIHGFSCRTLQIAAWLTWPMLLAATANAWWGTNQMLPIAAQQAGASGGAAWQEVIVTATHAIGGFALVFAWVLLLIALWRTEKLGAL